MEQLIVKILIISLIALSVGISTIAIVMRSRIMLKEWVKNFVIKVVNIVRKIGPLNWLVKKISNELIKHMPVDTYVADFLALCLLIFYFAGSSVLLKIMNSIVVIWYTRLLNVIFAYGVLLILFNIVTNLRINNINKEVPEAINQISTQLMLTGRNADAIKDAIPLMPKHISKHFKLIEGYLSSQTTFRRGIEILEERSHNETMTLFCKLMYQSIDNQADVSEQLIYLYHKSSYRNYLHQRVKRKLLWAKLTIFFLFLGMMAAIYFVKYISPTAYIFYSTMSGAILINVSLLSILFATAVVILFERGK